MKLKWWIIAVVLVGAGALAGAYAFRRSQKQQQEWEQARLVAALGGDAAAFESLRPLKERAVELVEAFIQKNRQFGAAALEKAVAELVHTNEPVRCLAQTRLILAPDRASDFLKACCDKAPPDSELRDRLRTLVANRPKLHKQISGQLTGLYSENFNRLFKARRAALARDCQNLPAQLFFAYAPFDQVWAMLRDGPSDARLRFLLLRLYTEREGPAMELLERFSSTELLQEAARSWWPLELEPLSGETTGGHVLRAAALQGNTAMHLLRISLRPVASPGARAEWAAVDRWRRWTWIFQFQEPIQGWMAIAYGEGEAKAVNQAGRPGIKERAEHREDRFWLPEGDDWADSNLSGQGHCELPHLVPESARLPKVGLTRQEAGHWQNGVAYEWARSLFPAAIQTHLHFAANQYAVPRIVTDSDPPAKATRNKRTRKRNAP